ncbi:MAG: hypothetical protein K2M94_03200 [Paramuribaculum sp.]|nr:hypothetical protein [Paramuribaculum sp.]
MEYVLTPITVEDKTYLADFNCTADGFEESYRREEDGKMYGFAFNNLGEGIFYAEYGDEYDFDRDEIDDSLGKEYFMHDFNTWSEGNQVEWTYFTLTDVDQSDNKRTYIHKYKTPKEQINNLKKLESPEGDYWMWAYQTDAGEWRVKGLGYIDGNYMTFNHPDGIQYIPTSLVVEAYASLYEVRSPEGEIYFRHPDYTPDDDLGAIAAVTPNNGVNITCNAGEVCVTATTLTDVEIFTAQGMKVYGASAVKHTTCKLQQGLYIVRAGSTAKKVAVK